MRRHILLGKLAFQEYLSICIVVQIIIFYSMLMFRKRLCICLWQSSGVSSQ